MRGGGRCGKMMRMFCAAAGGAFFPESGKGVFRAPARVTFGRSPKSDQKGCLKPKVSRLPARYALAVIGGLCRTVAGIFLCRADKRIVSASAPLPLISATVEAGAPAFQSVGADGAVRPCRIFPSFCPFPFCLRRVTFFPCRKKVTKERHLRKGGFRFPPNAPCAFGLRFLQSKNRFFD